VIRRALRPLLPSPVPPVTTGARPDIAPHRAAVTTGVHIAFIALAATSALRYLSNHADSPTVPWVWALSLTMLAAYALVLVLVRRSGDAADGAPGGAAGSAPGSVAGGTAGDLVVGVRAARALRASRALRALRASRGSVASRARVLAAGVLLTSWGVLVTIAPSFAWSAFPLFFVCRTTFRGRVAHVLVGGVAVLTAAGLFSLSGGTDWAAILGPPCVAYLLTLVYDGIERDAATRVALQEEVSEAHARLATSQREAGVLAERQRLAREIHDTVTQSLTSSLLLLEAADQTWDRPGGGARRDVRIATGSVRANLAETRNLVHDLTAPRLDPLGFHDSLVSAARGQVPGATLRVEGEARALPADVAHALLRITQSAAANVRRHAGAAVLGLTLTYLPETVALDVVDDGAGFLVDALGEPSRSGGYGLRAMRQRVDQLGGDLSIESAPGDGTAVAVLLPTPTYEGASA
jgi:signal transduction histidine kinase